jgi:hypothetical protein
VNVVVLVPFGGGDPHRERAWAHARGHWEAIGTVVEGHDEGTPFSKAAAVNDAAHRAGAWDVAVITDADTIVPRSQILQGLRFVTTGSVGCWPFNRFHRLTQAATERVLAGANVSSAERSATARYAPGGVVIVGRRIWDRVRGFDTRFRGWGGEDGAFIAAVRTYGRMITLPGPAYHLWHPHAETRYNGPVYAANHALSRRYGLAIGRHATMDALIAER